jgi:peptide/nickel transport system ATP-binding protein
LLAAVPRLGGEAAGKAAGAAAIASDLPSPLNPPAGCHFHPRCAHATDVCRISYPPVTEFGQGHRFRCHWPRLGD